jgi:hypothetical protein
MEQILSLVRTRDELEFHQESTVTVIRAQIEFECQLLFSYYCKLEYVSQRALIHEQIHAILGLGSGNGKQSTIG